MAQNTHAATAGAGNQVVGKVVILYGTVKAISPDGAVRLLMPNSPIYANDRIVTESDGSASIVFNGAQDNHLDLGRMTNVTIDHDVYATVTPEEVSDAVSEVEQIQQALLTGDQPIELEAPAAGGPVSAGGTHPLFVVAPTGAEVTPTSGLTTTGVTFGTTATIEAAGTDAVSTPTVPTTNTIVVTGPADVNEGGEITYTANVSHPAQGDITVNLSNGSSIIIPNGATSGSVHIPVHPDNPYIDAGTVTTSVTSAAGGTENIVVDHTPVVTQVHDVPTPTIAHITAVDHSITENAENAAIFNIHLDNAPQGAASVDVQIVDSHTGLTTVQNVALDANGDGQLVYNSAHPDAYVDPSTVTATITEVHGGNYEAPVTGASDTVNVTDITPPGPEVTTVHVTASAPEVNEDQTNAAIFNIHLDNAPQGAASVDVQIVDTNTGLTTVQTLALDANGNAQLVYNSADPDVYLDHTSVTATVTAVNGGGYEQTSVAGATATVDVVDTLTPTMAHITAVDHSITENAENAAIFNIHLDNAPQGAASVDVQIVDSHTGLTTVQTVALDANGDGQLVYNSAHPDAYVDPSTVTATITAVNGGNYEAPVLGASDTVNVTDITPPGPEVTTVHVTAASPEVNEDQTNAAIFNIHLDNAPQGAASVDVQIVDTNTGLTTVQTLALDANGNAQLVYNSADPDVYFDHTSVTATVTAVNGGGYEQTSVAGATATVDVVDTLTPTIAHITAVDHSITENAENAAIFNIHLDNAPQGAASVDVQIVDSHTGLTTVQNVALDANGDGQLVYNSAHPDAYVDPSTVTATITEVHGGNYEAPVTGASDTVNVIDITPPGPEVTTVHVTAASPEVNEDQTNAAIFNIHLDNAPQGAASVDVQIVDTNTGLTTVQTLALDANGNAQLVYNSADPDVYLDHTSVTATVTAVNGGGYEQTSVAGATATVGVVDTIDQTAVDISTTTPIISEHDTQVTFNIHLENAPQGAASASVNIYDSFTGVTKTETVILDADGNGSLTVAPANSATASITATVTAINGGNYEGVDLTGAHATASVDHGITLTPVGVTVSEANLPDGTSPSAASLAQTGSLTITALDGVSTVHIGNTDISISALHNLGTSDSISIDGVMYGHMEVTGYTDTATGGTLQYSFTLNDNVLTPPASVESYLEQVSVGVTDANGSVANSSLGITIVDDHPTFTLIDHAIVGNENSSTAGVLYGNHDINFGADSIGSISVVGDSLSGKLSYEYTTHADGSVTAAAYSSTNHTADTHFFDLTINTDGTYAFDMVNARATFASGNISLLNVNGGAATNSFVLNDATFNAIDTNHSGSIGNAEQLKPTASGFGVGNGNVDVGEQFNVTFANGIAVDSISLYSKVQAAGSLTMSYETKYFNPDGTEGHDSGSATLDSNGLMHFDPVHDFTSITFTVTSGTGKLDSFSFSERLIPNDETLHFQVSATDGDGDVSGTHPLDVTLLGVHPAGTLIAGTTGNDAIIGTSGDDVISGGAGHNTLTGGAGADTFKVGAGDDTIKDFTANQDKIVIEPTHTDALFAHDQGTNTAHLTITNNGAPVGTVTFENVGDTAAADNLLNSLLNDDPTVHK